jgi:hypothetical protein
MNEQSVENDAPRRYAESDDERCWHEDCWLLDGHDGLHAPHPAMHGRTRVASPAKPAVPDLLEALQRSIASAKESRVTSPGEGQS